LPHKESLATYRAWNWNVYVLVMSMPDNWGNRISDILFGSFHFGSILETKRRHVQVLIETLYSLMVMMLIMMIPIQEDVAS